MTWWQTPAIVVATMLVIYGAFVVWSLLAGRRSDARPLAASSRTA